MNMNNKNKIIQDKIYASVLTKYNFKNPPIK